MVVLVIGMMMRHEAGHAKESDVEVANANRLVSVSL